MNQMDHNPQGGRYAPVNSKANGSDTHDDRAGDRKGASPAKSRGNKVHQRLKVLALAWIKRHHPRVEERLRKQARSVEERKAAGR